VSVELFRDDDQGYAAWLAANTRGYVLNIQRSLNSSDARVPEAGCRTITRDAAPRQNLDRLLCQGMFALAAGTGRLGTGMRQLGHRPMRHLPTISPRNRAPLQTVTLRIAEYEQSR
jgi:hypothetical protein